jgi:hypothetical protein
MVLAVSVAMRLYFVSNNKSFLHKTSSALLLFTFLTICQFAFTQPWQIYKDSALNNEFYINNQDSDLEQGVQQSILQPIPQATDENILTDNYRSTSWDDPITVILNYRAYINSNFLKFLQFKEDPLTKSENNFFINTLNENRLNCYFIISSNWYPFYDLTSRTLSGDCLLKPIKSSILEKSTSKIAHISQKVFIALSNLFIFIYVILTYLGRFKFLFVFIYPITFIAAYTLSAATIDRYTIGVFPFYISLSFISILIVLYELKKVIIKSLNL